MKHDSLPIVWFIPYLSTEIKRELRFSSIPQYIKIGMNRTLKMELHTSVLDIQPEAWNLLVKPEDPPFLEWEWFAALEGSGSIGPETGWQPCHLTLWDKERLLAIAPFYIKSHSGGEFVYDYFWAEAAEMLNRSYYPKMVGVIPATPVVGYRFLVAEGHDPIEIQRTFLDLAESICNTYRIHGIHILFPEPNWAQTLTEIGFSKWKHNHYQWENPGYRDFSDYLQSFNKNQRKNIRKERMEVQRAGIRTRIVPASEGGEAYFRHMFDLYNRTNDKFAPYDARYVNEDFFLKLNESFAHRIFFVEAAYSDQPDDPLALAFLVKKGNTIWGRYWGTYEDIKDLHFEVCYYAPIQWAIENHIRFFDPGAGSPHKVRRGFWALPHFSYHRLLDPLLDQVFRANIDTANQFEDKTIEELNSVSPLKVTPP